MTYQRDKLEIAYFKNLKPEDQKVEIIILLENLVNNGLSLKDNAIFLKQIICHDKKKIEFSDLVNLDVHHIKKDLKRLNDFLDIYWNLKNEKND